MKESHATCDQIPNSSESGTHIKDDAFQRVFSITDAAMARKLGGSGRIKKPPASLQTSQTKAAAGNARVRLAPGESTAMRAELALPDAPHHRIDGFARVSLEAAGERVDATLAAGPSVL